MLRNILLSSLFILLAACGETAPEIKADNDSPE